MRHRPISWVVNAHFYSSIPPDLWPANSTDLNPVEYKIWVDIQQRVHQLRLHSVDELNKRLLDVWRGMDQSVVDDAVDEWPKRL